MKMNFEHESRMKPPAKKSSMSIRRKMISMLKDKYRKITDHPHTQEKERRLRQMKKGMLK